MSHKFNPQNFAKLGSPQRRKLLPPEETLRKLEFKQGQKVADVGCGIGYFSLPLARLVGNEGHVYALDIIPEMLEEARRRTRKIGISNLSFHLSEESAFPLQEAEVDAVLLAAVVHELEDRDDFFKEITRILKPNGQLRIIEWKKEQMQMGPPVDHRVGLEEMKQILAESGFNVENNIDLGAGHYGVVCGKM